MNTKFINNLYIFLIFILLFMFPVLLYRIEVYNLINIIYPEFSDLKFYDYLLISRNNDLQLAYKPIILIFLISFIPFILNKNKIIILGIMLCLYSVLYLIFAEFFSIYQTSFQINFIGKEHFTGITAMLSSAFAEISAIFYFKTLFISLLISVICFFLYKKDDFILNKIFFYISAILFLLSLFYLFPSADVSKISILNEKDNPTKQKMISQILEFSINPFNEFISVKKQTDKQSISSSVKFAFKFNTDSLESDKRIHLSGIIPKNKKYNIILYFFESTAYSYLDIKIGGKEVTGEMNRLSRNSFFAKNHYANFPLSANALLSVLSSSYDSNSKDPVISVYPDIKLKTISEILKDNGYNTALIHTGGLGYAGQNRFLKNRKFDKIIEFKELEKIPPYNKQVGWGLDERAMIEPAVNFIKESGNEPYFLTFLPVNPHHPYAIPDQKFNITKGMNSSSWSNYLNSLYYSDYALGELIKRLESEKMLDNTLVFIFADHGEAFYQHKGNYNHPFYLYEENIHVPFMIYNKKLFPDKIEYDGITRHIDIAPTILNLMKINPPYEYEGVPIFSSKREQLALIHTFWKDDIMAIRDGKWKYIFNFTNGFEELYDISADMSEKNNISADNKIIAKRYANLINSARIYKKEFYNRILLK